MQELNQLVLLATVGALAVTFAVGSLWARKAGKRIQTWYDDLQAGTSADQVLERVQRDVLDAPLRSVIITRRRMPAADSGQGQT